MTTLRPHRSGDHWGGHIWIYRHPETGDPYDLTAHRFDLQFRLGPDSPAAWSLSTEGPEPSLELVDGDGCVVRLACGGEVEFALVGFPWAVRLPGQVPPLAPESYDWELEHRYPDGQPLTEDWGKWRITSDITRPEP